MAIERESFKLEAFNFNVGQRNGGAVLTEEHIIRQIEQNAGGRICIV